MRLRQAVQRGVHHDDNRQSRSGEPWMAAALGLGTPHQNHRLQATGANSVAGALLRQMATRRNRLPQRADTTVFGPVPAFDLAV